MTRCRLLFICFNFLLCGWLCAQGTGVQWTQVQPGIWKVAVGEHADLSLLSLLGNQPRRQGLEELPGTGFPINKDEIMVHVTPGKIMLRFPLDKDEAIYGLGLNFQTVNQRGRILNLHVDHYGGNDNGRTHAPVPFYISSKGYGVLIDAAAYMTFYVGTANRKDAKHPAAVKDRNTDSTWKAQPASDAIEVQVPANGLEIYVFEGPTPLNVVQRYNLFNGGGCLPPKWGLGFTQRVPTLYNSKDVLKEVREFESHQFPLDFIGLEPGWQSSAYPCTLDWDSTRFPDPAGFLKELGSRGVRANLWFNPYISPKSALYRAILPLSGSHTVWNGIVPDITLSSTRQILKDHFDSKHLKLGVAAYKIDEVDGYDNWLWPDVASFPSGHTAEQMRQVYGLLWQKMTLDWFKEKNQRTYGLVRGSNAGASSLPYVIYNDYYSHRDFITALINSSFIGVLWVPEVRASQTAEEWIRRMQTVCFSPMAMLDAWSDGTKPWTFPSVEKGVRNVALLRMELLPYLYNCFAQYHFRGLPPFRAMQLTEGFGFQASKQTGIANAVSNPYALDSIAEIRDQYMAGDEILVAPFFAGDTKRKVYLPPGKWYDFYSGRLVGENEIIEISPDLEKIPLFVKDGGIIPTIPARLQAPVEGELLQLEIRHYGAAENSLELYDDDGLTFNYEQGDFTKTVFSVKRDKKGMLEGNQPKTKGSKFYHYLPTVKWKFMTPSRNLNDAVKIL